MKLTNYLWCARVPTLASASLYGIMAIFCFVISEPQRHSVRKRFTVILLRLRVVVHPIEDGVADGLVGVSPVVDTFQRNGFGFLINGVPW